jgi:uncharacterized protein (DUF58 family)
VTESPGPPADPAAAAPPAPPGAGSPGRAVHLSWGPRAAGAALAGVLLFGLAGGSHRPGEAGHLLGAGALVALVADFVLLRRALRRLHLDVAAPSDATAGNPFDVQLSLAGPRRVVRVGLADDPEAGRFRLEPPVQAATLRLVAPPRGSYGRLSFVVDVDGLLGGGHLTCDVPLREPLDVGPQPVPAGPVEPVLVSLRAAIDGARPAAGWAEGDSVRSVREYVPGDSPRVVHWALSARHGHLVVRELEPFDDAERVVLVVDLGPEAGDVAEAVAGQAASLGRSFLGRGFRLSCVTWEAGGRCDGDVPDPSALGRRLARAVPAGPADLGRVDHAAVVVSPGGDSVRGPGRAPVGP